MQALHKIKKCAKQNISIHKVNRCVTFLMDSIKQPKCARPTYITHLITDTIWLNIKFKKEMVNFKIYSLKYFLVVYMAIKYFIKGKKEILKVNYS